MGFAVLKLYDASNLVQIDLLGAEGSPGIRYRAWNPSLASSKGGGVRTSSSVGWGSRLEYKAWENIVDTFTLRIQGDTPDDRIYQAQELRRLLEKAESYWTSEWQIDPVVIEARGDCETNARYAIIKAYSAPDDSDPNLQPFDIDDEFILSLEHTFWVDKPPFTQDCVALSAHQVHHLRAKTNEAPLADVDDAHVNHAGALIFLLNPDLLVGGTSGNRFEFGVRFRFFSVPAGATIQSALLAIVSTNIAVTDGGVTKVRIRGQSNVGPLVFSTYADYVARVRTTSYIDVDLPYQVAGETCVVSGLEGIIQEIINLPGWVINSPLVLFFETLTATPNTQKRYAAWDNAVYLEPTISILYEVAQLDQGTVTPSCDLHKAYISNHHRQANITHLFYFDAGIGYSANLVGVVPSRLLPAVPAVGDILYVMTENVQTNGAHFCSALFNLDGLGNQFVGVWEFSLGAGVWALLNVSAGYSDSTDGLINIGTGGVFFNAENITAGPNIWAQDVVNGVTGYALRFRVTAVGGGPVGPSQVSQLATSLIWPDVKIDESQILGDIPAKVRTKDVHARDRDTYGKSFSRVILGTRLASRSARFQMCLNCEANSGLVADNPFLVPIYGAAVGWTPNYPDLWAPINRSQTFNPAGTGSQNFYWRILSPIKDYYQGTFRAFLRLRNTGGFSTHTVQFLSGTTYDLLGNVKDTIYFYGDVKSIVGHNTRYQIVDLGTYTLPPVPVERPGVDLYGIVAGFRITNGTANPDITFYDLILLPVDEFSCEIVVPRLETPIADFGAIGPVYSVAGPTIFGYGLLDSIWTKQSFIGTNLSLVDDFVLGYWKGSSSLFNGLQSNADQQKYFLHMEYNPTSYLWYSTPFGHFTLQDWALYQYLSSRGSR